MACFSCSSDKSEEKAERPLQAESKKRKCTDVLFLILFGVFLLGMFIVMITSFANGDPKKLVNGIDSRGCICGTKASYNAATNQCSIESNGQQLGEKSMLATRFSQLAAPTLSSVFVVCANTCPTAPTASMLLFCHNFATGASQFSSQNSTVAAYLELRSTCTGNTSAILTTSPSKSTFGYCVPSSGGNNSTSVIDQAFAKLQASNNFNDSVASVSASAGIMVVGALLAIVVGFAFLQLLSCFASIVVYTSLVLINLGFLLCALMLFQSATAYKENYPDTYQDMDDYSTAYYGAMAMVAVTVVCVLITIVLIPRVRLAIKVMKMTGNALAAAPMVMFVPVVTAALLLLTYGLWSVVSVYLFSVGDIKSVANPSLPGGVAREVQFDDTQRYAFLYHLFGLFWIGAFLRAVAQMIIGFIGVSWYFAPQEDGKRKPQPRLTLKMVCAVMYHHLGSAALGAFLIALVQFIRAVFEYYVRQSEKYQNNPVIKLTVCCVRCCLWCVECCLRFINKMAYIFIGLTGKPFVTAACTGISYVGTNALRVGTLLVLKAVFLTIGKLLTAAVPAGIVYLILSNGTYADPTSDSAVANPFLPATIVLLFGYMVGGTFASVYDTMSDAIIMSYCYNDVHKIFVEGESDPSADIKRIAAEVEEEEAAAAAAKVKPQAAAASGKAPEVQPTQEA